MEFRACLSLHAVLTDISTAAVPSLPVVPPKVTQPQEQRHTIDTDYQVSRYN
ncbi:uncharacterized protein FPRO_07763 [Fusarium proliferatum ET1]|uniref:Uncharacterized protein n=1 Tax=Fusarium proliferatum (strain ET1) TaxID=1227346 RepID=A0A1L7VTV0_FUSPR|nr:uncharacterized protein FPRO_07763 [Fusarium proliferatum ET1]CVK90046.1 uncharacterized protein FPRN_07519 [Fusarium proliferatum]CZR43320.1 uncharacterized protein FPRO_07763 [Fusarium proliferatum ET1]